MTFSIAPHAGAVTQMVEDASRAALDWFRRPAGSVAVDNKLATGFDPVTEADRFVERQLRAALLDRFPGHAVLGEEDGESGSGRHRWVIDPIDGTRAFISGQPMWGTLLGLQIDDAPVAGWMHLPVLHETYVAVEATATLATPSGERQLATSDVDDLGEAILLCTHPTMFVTDDEVDAFGRVESASRLVRYSGDCMNYALVASGDADLVVENQMQPYDVIPLIPIVEAAGGVISNRDGDPPLDGGWVIAAATPALHAQALAALNG